MFGAPHHTSQQQHRTSPPETAIPASLTLNPDLAIAFHELRKEVRIPHIVGTIDYRFPPGATSVAASRSYNTAALYADLDSSMPTATVDKAQARRLLVQQHVMEVKHHIGRRHMVAV